MRTVEIGTVVVFDNPQASKEQALKVLEEAAEVFGAWQNYMSSHGEFYEKMALCEEIADVIQACANLAYGLGCRDMQPDMEHCKQRNIDRGRITPDEPEPELKPCPFCGYPVYFHKYSRENKLMAAKRGSFLPPMICCSHCGAAVSFQGYETSFNQEAAIKAWNKRADAE